MTAGKFDVQMDTSFDAGGPSTGTRPAAIAAFYRQHMNNQFP
jgi:hypothetical protein